METTPVRQAAQAILAAEALLITAGAGMGVDSGLPDFRGGDGFWQGLCEEALANYLWQSAELPAAGFLRIEDLSSTLQRWLDSVLTVEMSENA